MSLFWYLNISRGEGGREEGIICSCSFIKYYFKLQFLILPQVKAFGPSFPGGASSLSNVHLETIANLNASWFRVHVYSLTFAKPLMNFHHKGRSRERARRELHKRTADITQTTRVMARTCTCAHGTPAADRIYYNFPNFCWQPLSQASAPQ